MNLVAGFALIGCRGARFRGLRLCVALASLGFFRQGLQVQDCLGAISCTLNLRL